MECSRLHKVHFHTKLASPREPLMGRCSYSCMALVHSFSTDEEDDPHRGINSNPIGVLLMARHTLELSRWESALVLCTCHHHNRTGHTLNIQLKSSPVGLRFVQFSSVALIETLSFCRYDLACIHQLGVLTRKGSLTNTHRRKKNYRSESRKHRRSFYV